MDCLQLLHIWYVIYPRFGPSHYMCLQDVVPVEDGKVAKEDPNSSLGLYSDRTADARWPGQGTKDKPHWELISPKIGQIVSWTYETFFPRALESNAMKTE